ncbi:DinB family protein [Tunicatimonas pelagia]|uniref:DinB family protein n=1 Tax=Tunicatimonas pelagia TaxID=931531 RepID=UPI00266595F6|nr:DinB family protein [Tunicatimonas pelagia]WKN40550.1 DinB family protein [Tunicatimonas pelagia]
MKSIAVIYCCLLLISCTNQSETSLTKTILLEEVKNNHTTADWYVPLRTAVTGLTAEQADWKDSVGTHSIRELLSHVLFWNEKILRAYRGEPALSFNGDNESTFTKLDNVDWKEAINRLDSVQIQWEQAVAQATEQQLKDGGSEIASMLSHMAYHTGQIVYIRKRNGWWKSAQGVE